MTLPTRRIHHLRGLASEIEADAEQLGEDLDARHLDRAIIAASTVEDNIGTVLGQLVAAHRDEGATWDQIGTLLGVTRQSAWQRFRHVDPPVPPPPSEG